MNGSGTITEQDATNPTLKGFSLPAPATGHHICGQWTSRPWQLVAMSIATNNFIHNHWASHPHMHTHAHTHVHSYACAHNNTHTDRHTHARMHSFTNTHTHMPHACTPVSLRLRCAGPICYGHCSGDRQKPLHINMCVLSS